MPKGPQLLSEQGLLQGFLTGLRLQLRQNHRAFARWFSNIYREFDRKYCGSEALAGLSLPPAEGGTQVSTPL